MAVEIHLKNASIREIDKQASQLREMYEVYKVARKAVRKPGDIRMSYNIRGARGAASGSDITTERLMSEAAKYRILTGIREHVAERVGDIASFDLAFDLACKELPEEIEIDPGQIAGGGPIQR